MRRIADKPLAEYHPHVAAIWRSRDDELLPEEFDSLPEWMDQDAPDLYRERDIKGLIEEALEGLTERELGVLRLRYWQDLTLAEVAAELSLTRGRVQQLEQAALHKLRRVTRCSKLAPYSRWSEWFKHYTRQEFKTRHEVLAARWNVEKRIEYPIGLWGFLDSLKI